MANTSLIGPHGHDFSALADVLERFRGEKVVFIPNPGNVGDALIDFGGYLIFEKLGVDFEYGRKDGRYPGRVVVYAGGGALIDAYPGGDEFLRNNHGICKALVLLPHTVRAHGDLLAKMDGRCILYAREQPTLAYLKANCTGAEVRLCDDLAFFVSKEDLFREPWDWGLLRATGKLGGILRMWIKFWWLALWNKRLNAFRVDLERTETALPARNYDIATFFPVGRMWRADCANALKCLVRLMQPYDEVATNRLHMSVMAAILGKQVQMHDNNYGKNSAIFEHSIKGRFDNVTFN